MIHILSETQNEIRFTNSATIYLEVATVKLAQASGSAAPSSSNQASEVDSQLINQLQAEIKELKKAINEIKTNGEPLQLLPSKHKLLFKRNKQVRIGYQLNECIRF